VILSHKSFKEPPRGTSISFSEPQKLNVMGIIFDGAGDESFLPSVNIFTAARDGRLKFLKQLTQHSWDRLSSLLRPAALTLFVLLILWGFVAAINRAELFLSSFGSLFEKNDRAFDWCTSTCFVCLHYFSPL